MSETRDMISIDDAVDVFRDAVVQLNVQRAVEGRIPTAQISILADMAANQFAVALYDKIRPTNKEGKDGRTG